MRVLQLHAGYRFPAGEDTVVANEADALRHGGHDVVQHIVANPSAIGPTIGALARSSYNRRAARDVAALLDHVRPDVVHVHNTWFALSTSVIEVAARDAPVVMTVHNYRLGCLGADLFRDGAVCTACVGRRPVRGVLHGCYRGSRLLSSIAAVELMAARRTGVLDDHVDTFVAPSAFMADRLVEIGVPAERLVVKPHFVADPGPRPARPSASHQVLCIGRLAPGKGLPTMLRAWERYTSAHRHDSDLMELVVIGDGPLAADLRERAPRGVRFEGWLDHAEVAARMLAARAFVFPSEWYEPFGMVLLEAMSAGLPIVATTASDARRIAAAPPGLIAPAGDAAALAAALERLTDDGAVDQAGAQGRARFEAAYTEAAGLAALEELYARTTGRER